MKVNELNKPLVIKSASAGSGKTYSLVQDYLKLTLRNGVESTNFSKIIAMTFTNKAAWEMKERIISALDQLANIDSFKGKVLEKAQGLMESTMKNTGLSSNFITEKSKSVLSEILHRYEDFNVLTIDKFSLRLIRTFSRDLDLQDNFEVTLDQEALLEKVIDEMISKIGRPEEEELTRLALSYAKSNINEGNSWDFRRGLIAFSTVLTRETDQEFVNYLLEKEFKDDEYEDIQKVIKELADTHSKMCLEAYQYFVSLHTTADDYPGKSRGIYALLNKLPERDLYNVVAPSKAVLQTLSGENVKEEHNVDGMLMSKVNQIFQFEEENKSKFYTLRKIRENFYNLSFLKYISNELNTFKEKENIIGIYEFGRKIADLLQRERTQYVYERLGNRYNHYLLDEFQDTSRLQWLNLIPLIHESISHGHNILIVGDPKQAIYRFRNGLVEQFVALPAIYNPEGDKELAQISNYFNEMGFLDTLQDNYRSQKMIVEFNNYIFKQLLEVLPPSFSDNYKDIRQNPKSSSGGFVGIKLLSNDVKNEDIQEEEKVFLLESVEKVIEDGYLPGDICVLTRNKKEGQRYAKLLNNEGYKIVSSDSLVVSSDASVGLCIDYLNLRRNTTNSSLRIKFAISYFKHKQQDPLESLDEYWIDNKVGQFNFSAFVKKEFENLENLFFPYENLYDLGVKICSMVSLDVLKNPYLHHFIDLLQEYDLKNGPDIRGFIDDWNASLHKSTIQLPENKDAIKIMTVHKSKGLEFPVVIMPNLSWRIKTHLNEHFIRLEEGALIYTKLKKTDAPDYILEKYQEEYEQVLLDEINALYVAFTRPSERLYFLLETKMPRDTSYYTQINQALFLAINQWENNEALSVEKSGDVIRIGEELAKVQEDISADESNRLFFPKDISDCLWFPDLALQDEEALEREAFNEEQDFGDQVHLVLSRLDENKSIDEIVSQLVEDAEVELRWIDDIKKTVNQVLNLLSEQDFVKNATQVMNEQAIIVNEQVTRRPDRVYLGENEAVVVDFKTGEPSSSHVRQIKEYSKLLYDMGYNNVSGYLLYTKDMRFEKLA